MASTEPEGKSSLTVRLELEERAFVTRGAKQEYITVTAWLRRLIRREMASEAANKPPRKPRAR